MFESQAEIKTFSIDIYGIWLDVKGKTLLLSIKK